MQAPRYVERNKDSDKYRERCFDIHQQKLKEISTKKHKKRMVDDMAVVSRTNIDKPKTHEVFDSDRQYNINKENQALLGRLFEISHGKWSSVNFGNQTARSRSLNMGFRVKESKRIEEENKMFAKRLFEKNAYLSLRKMKEDFDSHEKYKKQIQKVGKKKVPKHQGRANHLPPLNKETEGSNTHRTGNKLDNIEEETEKHTTTLDTDEKKKEIVSQKYGTNTSKTTKPDALLHKEIPVSQLDKQIEIFTKPLEKKEATQSKDKLHEKDRALASESPKKEEAKKDSPKKEEMKKQASVKAVLKEEAPKEEIKKQLSTQNSNKLISKIESKKELKNDQIDKVESPDEKKADKKDPKERSANEKSTTELTQKASQKSILTTPKELEEEKQEKSSEKKEEELQKALSSKKLSATSFKIEEPTPETDPNDTLPLENRLDLSIRTHLAEKEENEDKKENEEKKENDGGDIFNISS